jgi:hypothetical protein
VSVVVFLGLLIAVSAAEFVKCRMRWENNKEKWYLCSVLGYYPDNHLEQVVELFSCGVVRLLNNLIINSVLHTCHHCFYVNLFFLTYYVYTGTALYMETYLIHVLFLRIFHQYYIVTRAGIAQSVQLLATGWTTHRSEIEPR